MAIRSGFFNAIKSTDESGNITYDRTYYASDFTKYLDRVVSNGVFALPSDNLQVVAGDYMDVIVKAGGGRIDGNWIESDSDFTITLDESDVILDRVDRIVMQLNYADRVVDIVYKVGTPASNPVAPELVRTEQIQEYSLARINVGKGITSISQAKIIDTRPLEEECGLIATMGKMETDNFFIQMQDFVNQFIWEETTEYETWKEEHQTAFDTWFDVVKDEVRATSLYREYQSLYKSTEENQIIFPIPEEINFVNSSLDILDVYINGRRLARDIEFTIDTNGTQITLTKGLSVIGTDVLFVNKKSISESGAEEVVTRVEALEERMNALTDTETAYTCNGTDDNVILSERVRNFLLGVGEYSAAADNAQLRINVNGVVGISELIEDQSIFVFSVEHTSNRRVFVDFTNATIPALDVATYSATTFAVFNLEKEVTIIGANINIYGTNADMTSIYGFHGGNVEKCRVYNTTENSLQTINATFYAMYACDNASNSIIDITTNATAYGTYGVDIIENVYVEINGVVIKSELVNDNERITIIPKDGSNYGNYGSCWYYKKGTRVHVHLGLQGLTKNSSNTIFTLPVGYRPRTITAITGLGEGMGYVIGGQITSQGEIMVCSSSAYALFDVEFDAFG